ncbi:MAG: hypothetical protein K2W82_11215 [Candidatus Obscuribacterales bacterium]|nr:hypothetical protein [Candidatus Obscuribacterales bacterium]
MFHIKTSRLIAAILLVAGLSTGFISATQAQATITETVFLVEVSGARGQGNLSNTLRLALECDGILKGVDNSGSLLVSVPTSKEQALKQSKIVRSVNTSLPQTWDKILHLTLSYNKNNPLTKAELAALGVELVEDYARGEFLTVRLSKGTVLDAALVKKLEQNPKIRYATVVMRIKAVP